MIIRTRQFIEKVCFSKKVLVLNPYPQTPFPWKGAECGAAALTPLGATPQTPFFKLYRFSCKLTCADYDNPHPLPIPSART